MNTRLFTILITFMISSHFGFAQNDQTKYDYWDDNADGYVDDDEFEAGAEDEGIFDSFDSNADEVISFDEWTEGLEDNDNLEDDYFNTWDADEDNYVYRDEFYDGVFDIWDGNDDDWIDSDEYEQNYTNWSR